MFDFLKKKRTLRGYKITNTKRTKKYGVAVDSLKLLKVKATEKFQLVDCRVYVAKDGTEVLDEDYFQTIEPQSLFVVANGDETVQTDFELLYDGMKKVNSNVIEAGNLIQSLVIDNRQEFGDFLLKVQATGEEERTLLSSIEEHGEWFKGQDARCHTKEEAMTRRSQDRVRGYFYKAKDELIKSDIYRRNKVARELIDELLLLFQQFLTGCDYFGTYFDRSCPNKYIVVTDDDDDNNDDSVDASKETPRKRMKQEIKKILNEKSLIQELCVSLCNESGQFQCHGEWQRKRCSYSNTHTINPYMSRESLLLFQMWNLDHQVEVARTIIPSIVENAERIATRQIVCPDHQRPAKQVTVLQYFLELFTVRNLKLVHIVCHDKGAHAVRSEGGVLCDLCEEYQFLQEFLKRVKDAQK